MTKHGFNRYLAFIPIDVMPGILLELFLAIRATAKADFLPVPLQAGGPVQRFLRQTGRAYDDILCLLEIFPGIRDKQINA
jgi:hypothetical protein